MRWSPTVNIKPRFLSDNFAFDVIVDALYVTPRFLFQSGIA